MFKAGADSLDVTDTADHRLPCGIISNVPRQPPPFSHSSSWKRTKKKKNDYNTTPKVLRRPIKPPWDPVGLLLDPLGPPRPTP